MAHQIEDVDFEEGEEEYDENADEDFNPEAAGGEEDGSASEDDEETEAAQPTTKKRKKDAPPDELDSGDEATIQERKTKRRKKDAEVAEEDDRSGGEGGLIRTRAQRAAEESEKKKKRGRPIDGAVTVDVDKLWADLSSMGVGRMQLTSKDAAGKADEEDKENAAIPAPASGEDTILIKRRIEYAGEVTEIEERVPRSSREAQQYLADHPDSTETPSDEAPLNKPLKRPTLFEPNPTGLIKNVPPHKLRPHTPSRADVLILEQRAEEERRKKAERMTTVQKSAIDWRGFVEGQEGLREELDEYGKSKKGFMAREDFLGRVELAREGRGREARMKG